MARDDRLIDVDTVSSETLLAVVAVINALAAAAALIIHALRVPYRESNAAETAALTDAGVRLRASVQHQPPPPPGPPV